MSDRSSQLKDRVGHHATAIYFALIVLTFPMYFIPEGWISRAAATVHILLVLGVILLGFVHDQGMCEPCLTAMPLDGEHEAKRKLRRLRLYHSLLHPRTLIILAVIILGPGLLPMLWPQLIAAAVTMPVFMYGYSSTRVHRKLEPWCPYCNWGHGDGDHEEVPDPSVPEKV